MQTVISQFQLKRHSIKLTPDPGRTIVRLFMPGDKERVRRIGNRILSLSEIEAEHILGSIYEEFGSRHPDLKEIFLEHFRQAHESVALEAETEKRKLLIGAYFSMEYSFESAALFNPSMVQAIDQSNVPSGGVRFLMSLRAVGEGHLSSIVFRSGIIDSSENITIEEVGAHPSQLRQQTDTMFRKADIQTKLAQLGLSDGETAKIFDQLPEVFSYSQFVSTTQRVQEKNQSRQLDKIASRLLWIAKSNYRIETPKHQNISDMVLFPISESEAQGMEDMRLVRFTEDDRSVMFCGTYTAFDGRKILPQLLTVKTPGSAQVNVLLGKFAQNKGLALFPRRINSYYMMIGRVDGENNYLLRSKDIHVWNEGDILQVPRFAWEFMQIGNCGSPIETEAGWLVLTHGVGPLRRYCMGAILLDIDDPSKIIGQLREPLLVPQAQEWSGYVPNVVYSCGAMIHNGMLYIPYGISDTASGFVSLAINELLNVLRSK